MINSQGSRICRECLWFRNNTPTPVTADKLRLVFERLNEGETLSSVFGKKPNQSFIVRHLSLVHLMNQRPRIKRKILTLSNKNRLAVLDRIHAGNRLRAAPALVRNDGANAYEAVMRATAHLWEGERGDVMSLMFLAIAEGRLLPRDAERRMPEFLREHRRQFSKFGPLSLDAPIFGDSTITLGDTITTGLWQ